MAVSRRDDDGLTGWALSLAFVVALFFLVLSRSEARNRLASPLISDEITSPVLELLSKPIRSSENLLFNARDRARAHEENKILRAELSQLREKQARIDVMRLKIERYEEILGADTDTEIPLKKIAARAVAETNGPFAQSLLINVGREDNVAVGNPVMSSDGLVGHVIRIGGNSSRVLKLEDLNSRIAVMTLPRESRAILSGDNTQRPKLSFVSDSANWRDGDIVITSGDDGMLPQGLIIGKAMLDTQGELRVRLNTTAKPIDWVWVYPFKPVLAPTEGEPIAEDVQTEGSE